MKQLITKSDGTPTKSKVHALQFLEKNGIPKEALIAENGQFYYDTIDLAARSLDSLNDDLLAGKKQPAKTVKTVIKEEVVAKTAQNELKAVNWETPVFKNQSERTELFIPSTDVVATIIGKHPAGQNRSKSAFEINIGDENFVMSVDLLSRIFKVKA